jgi:hypothetical protein
MDPPQMDSGKAIEVVGRLRPGIIETAHQERFIERYVPPVENIRARRKHLRERRGWHARTCWVST